MLELLLINSLIIFGIHSNAGYPEGKPQVFTWLHKIKAPWWLKKPLIECISCMASLHSVYVYWPWIVLTGHVSCFYLLAWLPYVVALAGLNYVINSIITMGENREIYKNNVSQFRSGIDKGINEAWSSLMPGRDKK